MQHPLLTSCRLQEDGCTKDSGRSSRDRGLATWLQRLSGQGLGAVGDFRAVRGFGTGGCSPPLQRDDADAVLGGFDSPPPAKPADERDGGYPPPSPWRSRGGAAPLGSTREGGQYRCSCPRPATRKSPAAENLRLLTKPTWRGQGRVRGPGSLLLPPREGSPCPEMPQAQLQSPTSPSIPTGCPRGAPASEIPRRTSRASRWRCGSLGQREKTAMHSHPGKGAGRPPLHTPTPKQLPHTCSQEVTVAQGGHC